MVNLHQLGCNPQLWSLIPRLSQWNCTPKSSRNEPEKTQSNHQMKVNQVKITPDFFILVPTISNLSLRFRLVLCDGWTGWTIRQDLVASHLDSVGISD
jgi:hypothetical protein